LHRIEELRCKIDEIDDKLLKLLNRRAELAIQIGQEKSKSHATPHFHVPHREREIIERLIGNNKGMFPNTSVEAVFREIFSATLALEKPLLIAYFGPATTFTHQAALKQFGHSAIYNPLPTIDAVFREVEKGNADYGVVPIENSIEGVVNLTLDSFIDSPLVINEEIKLGISLYFLSKTSDPAKIKRIYSHPQPFAQCRNWLGKNYPNAEQIPASSTAQAAQIASQDESAGAVASKLAAEYYQLEILGEKIEDQRENHTRFMVIGKEKAKKTRRNKTSIMFSIKDESGSLLKALQLFAKHKINLTKIQSRPLRNRLWEYLFYLDFDGHIEDKTIANVIGSLSKQSLFLKILGSYPRKV
jgi:chorismate mutase/prephenate dehydratase